MYSNLARARDVSGVPEVLYEDLCFDVQQAVEKAIKAVLLAYRVPFPKTHAIAELVTLLEGNGIPFSEDVRQSVRLTRYAVGARYPGLEEEVTAEEHKRAVDLAESNRSPFELPETENELVSGFLTEYGGIKFALYFVAEYTAMVVNSAIVATIFLGGWKWPAMLSDLHPLAGVALFLVKVVFVLFLFVWIRASIPRVRYDKFMRFCWKFAVPLALANLAVTAVVLALV